MNKYSRLPAVSEQLARLRDMGKPWVGRSAVAVFLLPALVVLYFALARREYGLLPFVAGLGFFAGICFQGMPAIRRAIRGIDSLDRRLARVRIWTEEWSESVDYMAEVTVSGRGVWQFQFRPQHWTPETGMVEAECCFVGEVPWPVLLLTAQGILYPCDEPKVLLAPEH